MKTKQILIFCFLSILSVSKAQDLKKEMEGKKWYVQGTCFDYLPLVLSSVNSDKTDWDLIFMKDGRVLWHEITKYSSFDENGNEVGPGIEFTDTTFTYTFKNNLIKMYRHLDGDKQHKEVNFYVYYKIELMEDKKSYQFSHITREEFNK